VLRILWELRTGGLGFRELQRAADDPSPTLPAERLVDLRAALVVVSREDGKYELTEVGRELLLSLGPRSNVGEDVDSRTRGNEPAANDDRAAPPRRWIRRMNRSNVPHLVQVATVRLSGFRRLGSTPDGRFSLTGPRFHDK